jgi:penicillin-binding protein 2
MSTERRYELRDLAFATMMMVAFGAIVLRLYDVQIDRGDEYLEKSRENFFQLRRIAHDRGEIVDREGRVLVANRASLDVAVTPAFLPPTRLTVQKLGAAAGLDKQARVAVAAAFVRTAAEGGPSILLAQELDEAAVSRVLQQARELELPRAALPVIAAADGHYAVYLDPDQLPSEQRIYSQLREILDLSEREFELFVRRSSQARGLDRYREVLVRSDVTREMGERLFHKIELGELPGVTVQASTARHYRAGTLAAHLLGYVNELTPAELEGKKDNGYRLGDVTGRRGVERAFEEDLRGVDGTETVVVDSKGRPQEGRLASRLKGDFGERVAARAGNRVVLSIDLDLQRAAEQAFTSTAGAVVVLDVNTGRVLAVTSTPTFDPNKVSGYFDPREKARLDAMDQLRPWRFRAIQDHFAPGSTFKVVTLLAAMDVKQTHAHDTVSCRGVYVLGSTRFRCWRDAGHGVVDPIDSIAKSCDVYFYTLGNRMGLDPIAHMGELLGFGHKTGIALDGESDGIMPSEDWYERKLPEGYTRGAAVNVSIGQGAVTVTPMQLAVAYAAIANGGTVYEPQIALRIEAFDGSAVREFPPKVVRQVTFAPEALEMVREGLRRVVNHPGGTAYGKRLPDLEVSGKTGTAQVARMGKRIKSAELPYMLRDHAWFAAFAPSSAPEIAIVVMNEHGGGGSSTAAPIAMAVARAWDAKRKAKSAALPGSP